MASTPDAIVVGSGPNALSAAITIAQTGRSVTVVEAADTIGGGCRSAARTEPGIVHDLCSAVHPLAAVSPFFRSLPLTALGVEWVKPPFSLAHPFDGGPPAMVSSGIGATAAQLGEDASAYQRLFEPIVGAVPVLEQALTDRWRMPPRPAAIAHRGLLALRSIESLVNGRFRGIPARALLGGSAAHGMLRLDASPTAGVALVLGALAHHPGWVFPRGGAQALADALATHLRSLGGTIVTGQKVRWVDDLPPARAVLCDLSPSPFLRIAGHRLPSAYRRSLERYRYGMGVFKVDWALTSPIPWRDADCRRAGTLHLGGSFEEIASAERDVWEGRHADRPFVILAQPTLFDSSRAPVGRHVAWGYCHVPHGSDVDMLPRIERQIERFAPGFRDCVAARAVMRTADVEAHNPNYVGGDIAAGVTDLRQLLTRPTWRTYSTPVRGLYLCSASTPPGVGVHGMCGYFAARRALRQVFRD